MFYVALYIEEDHGDDLAKRKEWTEFYFADDDNGKIRAAVGAAISNFIKEGKESASSPETDHLTT